MTRVLSMIVATALAVGVASGARASVLDGQFWGNWGDWFKKPHGGDICLDGDGTVVPCPGSPPPDAGRPDQPEQPDDESWMQKPRDKDDSFCNLCHVNRTTEVAAPRMLSSVVLGDPPRFWRRHGEVAARVVNKRVLASVRDTRALSPTMQRLMAAKPAR